MDVIPMLQEIAFSPDAMIGESTLPDLLFAANDLPQRVRRSTFNKLNCTFERDVVRRSQQKMNMLGHNHERMQFKLSSSPIAEHGLQK